MKLVIIFSLLGDMGNISHLYAIAPFWVHSLVHLAAYGGAGYFTYYLFKLPPNPKHTGVLGFLDRPLIRLCLGLIFGVLTVEHFIEVAS